MDILHEVARIARASKPYKCSKIMKILSFHTMTGDLRHLNRGFCAAESIPGVCLFPRWIFLHVVHVQHVVQMRKNYKNITFLFSYTVT